MQANSRIGICNRQSWTWLVHRSGEGAWHMEVDLQLLHRLEAQDRPETILRFYQWSGPTLSVGYHQPLDSAFLQRAHDAAIDVVRRPTGGRAVLHGGDFSYSVVSNQPQYFGRGSLRETYSRISRALRLGLLLAGISTTGGDPVRIAGRQPAGYLRPDQVSSARLCCFSSSTRFELQTRGKKIVGSAQRRLRRAFLQHGSIPVQDTSQWLSALFPGAALSFTSLSEQLGVTPSFDQLCELLRKAFEQTFRIRLQLS